MLTSSSGKSLGTFTYGAFGALTGCTGSQTTPLGYAGQYTATQSGLQYLRARFYDPATAQFMTKDPLEAITRQPYAYAENNPLNESDPSGLGWFGTPVPSPGEAVHAVLDVAALPPYASYYAANKLANAVNSVGSQLGVPGQVAAHALNIPLALAQAEGLSEDALIDWFKGHTVNEESICDEGNFSSQPHARYQHRCSSGPP